MLWRLFMTFRQLVADVFVDQWPTYRSASLEGRTEGKQSYHTGTYFSPLRALAVLESYNQH